MKKLVFLKNQKQHLILKIWCKTNTELFITHGTFAREMAFFLFKTLMGALDSQDLLSLLYCSLIKREGNRQNQNTLLILMGNSVRYSAI